ncbi:MAG: hypothetical protein AVDCRST_MAG18-4114, partial [uncultured Thermomicrobiales bacterium]
CTSVKGYKGRTYAASEPIFGATPLPRSWRYCGKNCGGCR